MTNNTNKEISAVVGRLLMPVLMTLLIAVSSSLLSDMKKDLSKNTQAVQIAREDQHRFSRDIIDRLGDLESSIAVINSTKAETSKVYELEIEVMRLKEKIEQD